MKRQTFLGGAAVIAAGGFVAKLIGALYRIPLTNLIGGHGMGLYQMVYPFYCLLLTVSATGSPSSVAKLTAEKRAAGASDRALLKSAFKLFLSIGAAGTLFMALFAPLLSALQGSPELKGGYFALAPAVFFVSGISVLRGWFQGRNNMFPTAFSEVAEQVVKVGFGLLFAYLYRGDVQKAVTFILLSVSLSELFALLLMLFLFRREKNPFEGLKEGGRAGMKGILRLSIPATLASAVLPLSSLAESVIVVRLLKGYTSTPWGCTGCFRAGRRPSSISPSPSVTDRGGERARRFGGGSRGRGRAQKGTARPFRDAGGEHPLRRRAVLSGGHGGGVGLPRLSAAEAATLTKLTRVMAVSAVTLSCTQTLSACLTGLGRPGKAALSMGIAAAAKLALDFLLVSRPEISVYGAAIAADVCYLVAFALDLVYNLSVTKKRQGEKKSDDHGSRFGRKKRGSDRAGQTGDSRSKAGRRADGADGVV